MLARVHSAAVLGIDARVLDVEVDVSGGLPCFNIVGLPDTSVREARERRRDVERHAGVVALAVAGRAVDERRVRLEVLEIWAKEGCQHAEGKRPFHAGAAQCYLLLRAARMRNTHPAFGRKLRVAERNCETLEGRI